MLHLRLRDVLASVGVRSVADHAGVAPGTVSHHFPSKSGRAGEPNPTLARAVVEHVLSQSLAGTRSAQAAVAEIVDPTTGRGDGADPLGPLTELASSGESPLSNANRDLALSITLLAATVAGHDPDARRPLRAHHEARIDLLVEVIDATLDLSGRRMAEGTSERAFARSLTALIDGFAMQARYDPHTTADLLTSAGLRLFDSFTVSHSAVEEPDPEHTLFARVDPPADAAGVRETIAAAALRRYRAGGWRAVSLTAVAADTGVSRQTAIRCFGHRNTLAAAIWATFIPTLEHGLRHDEQLRVDRLLGRHVQRLAELAHRHPRLTAALVSSFWYQTAHVGPPTGASDDPRVIAPVPFVLVPVLEQHRSSFRAGLIDSPSQSITFAGMLTNHALTAAIARQESATDIAAYVVATTIAGALTRRPPPF
ncbi:MAG TPA: TetR family transcriptional regulator [Acidimicrobiales bacterium]|nr:TetR family transcriptional regulator [Acidimicrobiales bacterium]